MATDFDPYRILGVDRGASADDVRAAYERLTAEAPAGSERRREVEAAYAVLGSEEKRREYDSRLSLREIRGMPAASAEALTLAGAPAGSDRVPWTPRDIGLALILPLLLIALNVGAAITTNVDTDDLTETDHIIGFGFGFLLEAALLALAFNFAIRKYKGSWSSLGFRLPAEWRISWADLSVRRLMRIFWFPLAIVGGAFATIWVWVGLLYALGIAPDSNIPENVYDFAIPVIMLGLLSVIAAPLAEEVFFRGFLFQGVAKRWGMWAGITFSAFIFGLSHAGAPDSWLLLPAIAAIGGIFAWGFAKSGSIYPSLFAHVIFNSVSFILGFTE
ncbi:MAG: CPBP family intramembrane metalloprotease [Chloroflexi bacterium]|nr:CPBP family intramembrane metalloprotease [Chloroflexota bacterium]